MSDSVKCAACGSSRLTPPAPGSTTTYPIKLKSAKKGFFSDDSVMVSMRRLRVCLACGFVMSFVREEELAELRKHEGNLE
jgi:hypothetical protein